MKKAILTFVLTSLTTINSLHASVIFQYKNKIISQRVPYQQCLGAKNGSKAILRDIMDLSWEQFTTKIAPYLRTTSGFDREMSLEDIEEQNEMSQQVADSVELANMFVDMLEKDAGMVHEIDISETLPDAFMVYMGTAGKGNVLPFVKGGFNGNFGIVALPYCLRTYDTSVNQMRGSKREPISTDWGVDWALVGLGGASVGIGSGAGFRGRVGFGLIWNIGSDDFDQAEKFNGFYAGGSCTWGLQLGPMAPKVTTKLGYVKKADGNLKNDFIVFLAGLEIGQEVDLSCNVNFNIIVPLNIIKAFDDGLKAKYEEAEEQAQERINQGISDLFDSIKEKQKAEQEALDQEKEDQEEQEEKESNLG